MFEQLEEYAWMARDMNCCLKSIWKLLKSILRPTHLTAIFKSFTVPKEGDALQGGKVEKSDKVKKRGGRGEGSHGGQESRHTGIDN